MTPRRFIVVSGLPASGKSTLAHAIAPRLGLPVIDKDDVLDRLFESEGIGDMTWRRELSRRSDMLFRQAAEASNGAVLTSFWHQPGMDVNSGTPVDWVLALSPCVVHLHCVCPPALAAARFIGRQRHAGHLDAHRDPDEVRTTFAALAALGVPPRQPLLAVDTSGVIDPIAVAAWLAAAVATSPEIQEP